MTATDSRRTAFTLAEVLITLGIIGVVAALTIPTLVQNSQKKQVVTGLQKVFSEFSQAYALSQVENGDAKDWVSASPSYDRANELAFFKTYMMPYFKSAKMCDSADASDFYNCWPSDVKNMDGSNYAVNTGQSFTFLLSDGMSVHVGNSDSYGSIYVDVNGMKKPNIIGRDIFRMNYRYNGFNGIELSGIDKDRDEILSGIAGNLINSCNKTSWGTSCGAVIQQDGWQIKDDYPWN